MGVSSFLSPALLCMLYDSSGIIYHDCTWRRVTDVLCSHAWLVIYYPLEIVRHCRLVDSCTKYLTTTRHTNCTSQRRHVSASVRTATTHRRLSKNPVRSAKAVGQIFVVVGFFCTQKRVPMATNVVLVVVVGVVVIRFAIYYLIFHVITNRRQTSYICVNIIHNRTVTDFKVMS